MSKLAERVTIKETTFREISATTESWGWARLLMEESTGRVVIVSDYGEWSYCWTSIGSKTLSEFLAGLNWHYMGEKMLGSRLMEHSDESTIKGIRNLILEYRRDGTISKQDAANEWRIVKEYEDGWTDFRGWGEETKFFECPWDCSIKEPVGYWISFWNHIWTPLLKPALNESKSS